MRQVQPEVYAVGGALSEHAQWMAAVLTCGEGAVLSHSSAAALWGIAPSQRGPIEVTVPAPRQLKRRRVRVHRTCRLGGGKHRTRRRGIPVTTPVRTLLDLASIVSAERLERLVNEADKLDLVSPEDLRREVASHRREPGAAALRRLLDRTPSA